MITERSQLSVADAAGAGLAKVAVTEVAGRSGMIRLKEATGWTWEQVGIRWAWTPTAYRR